MHEHEIASLIKSYQWDELWRWSCSGQGSLQRAVRSYLSIAKWADYNEAVVINKSLKPQQGALYNFLRVMTLMGLANISGVTKAKNKMPKSSPQWMQAWIDIEYAGRQKNTARLIELVNRQLKKQPASDHSWVFIALLQLIDHAGLNPQSLNGKLLNVERDNPLSAALYARIDGATPDKITPHVLGQLAQQKHMLGSSLEALKLFDRYVKHKQLGYKNLSSWLSLAISLPQGRQSFIQRVEFAIKNTPDSLQLRGILLSYYVIYSWIQGTHKVTIELLKALKAFQVLPKNPVSNNLQVFTRYVTRLGSTTPQNIELYKEQPVEGLLYCIGESHSLSPANTAIEWNGCKLRCKSLFVMGVKMFHLGQNTSEAPYYYANGVKEYLATIPDGSEVLFCIGEIDTRPTEGIWKAFCQNKGTLDELVAHTVEGYIESLVTQLRNRALRRVTIQGVPAPGYELDNDIKKSQQKDFLGMIHSVNIQLKEAALSHGWQFLDVYSATVAEDGTGNGVWHIDDYHLKPEIYAHANDYLISCR